MATTINRDYPGPLASSRGDSFRYSLNNDRRKLYTHTQSLEQEIETLASVVVSNGATTDNTSELYIDNPVVGRVYCPVGYKVVIGGVPVVTQEVLEQGYSANVINNVWLDIDATGSVVLRVGNKPSNTAILVAVVDGSVPSIDNYPEGKDIAIINPDYMIVGDKLSDGWLRIQMKNNQSVPPFEIWANDESVVCSVSSTGIVNANSYKSSIGYTGGYAIGDNYRIWGDALGSVQIWHGVSGAKVSCGQIIISELNNSPLIVSSSVRCLYLNADMLDDMHASDFQPSNENLTQISELSGAGILRRNADGTWALYEHTAFRIPYGSITGGLTDSSLLWFDLSTATTLVIGDGAAGGTAGALLEAPAGQTSIIRFREGGAEYGAVYHLANSSDMYVRATHSSGSLHFMSGGANIRATINSSGNIILAAGTNIIANASSGNMIATASTQKLGFWGATPVARPDTSVASATFVANSGTAINTASTFDGYTLQQVVRALRNIGLLT